MTRIPVQSEILFNTRDGYLGKSIHSKIDIARSEAMDGALNALRAAGFQLR